MVDSKLEFIKQSKYAWINRKREEEGLNYPMGQLATPGHSAELHFLHYENESEAQEKWFRRKQRIVQDDDRLFFKFCDRDGTTLEEIEAFAELPFSNKVCFTAKPHPGIACVVWIRECEREGCVIDGGRLAEVSERYFSTAHWLRGALRRKRFDRIIRADSNRATA